MSSDFFALEPVPFSACEDEAIFGGKVVSLGAAVRAGLPVPPGYGLPVDLTRAVVDGNSEAIAAVEAVFPELAPAVAVRSSGVGEDSADASFAGQHDSLMNIRAAGGLAEAIVAVHASGHTESAIAYRQKVGASLEAAIAIALQKQVPSEKAGVLFTRNPLTGADERYVEVGLGLGEAVVSGLIVPDTYRFSRGGAILETVAGDKDIKLVLAEDGGTEELEVDEDVATTPCLSHAEIESLDALATRCEAVYGSSLDMEFAFEAGVLYLLQCRSITTLSNH